MCPSGGTGPVLFSGDGAPGLTPPWTGQDSEVVAFRLAVTFDLSGRVRPGLSPWSAVRTAVCGRGQEPPAGPGCVQERRTPGPGDDPAAFTHIHKHDAQPCTDKPHVHVPAPGKELPPLLSVCKLFTFSCQPVFCLSPF